MVSEAQLKMYLEGDNEAIAECFMKELPRLVFFANGIVKDKEEASDLVADVYEQLINYNAAQRQERFLDNPLKFRRFVYITVKRKSLDYLKRKKVRSNYASRGRSLFRRPKENLVDETFTQEVFEHMLLNFGERQEQILRLYIEGYSTSDIAEELGLSMNTVQATMTKCRSKVRLLWNDFFK